MADTGAHDPDEDTHGARAPDEDTQAIDEKREAQTRSGDLASGGRRRRLVGKQTAPPLRNRRYDFDFWGVAGGRRKPGRVKAIADSIVLFVRISTRSDRDFLIMVALQA